MNSCLSTLCLQTRRIRSLQGKKFFAAISVSVLLIALSGWASIAGAQTLTYSTDWLGNTFSGTNDSHVPNGIDAIAITPTGTTYANCWYDEAGSEVSEFSSTPAWVNFTGYLHGFGRSGGYAIAVNSTYVYVAVSQAEDLDNPIKTGSQAGQPLNNGNGLPQYPVSNSGSPNYTAVSGNYWDGIRRYTLAGATSAVATYGYSDESIIIVSTTENDSQLGTAKNPDGASIGATGPVLGIAANNTYVFASDNVNNKIHVYNASTMAPVGTWSVPAPGKMALDNTNGILWVVENSGNNTASSIVGFDATIPGTATAKGGSIACGTGQHVGAPNALAVDATSRLVIADNGIYPGTMSDPTGPPYVMYPKPDVGQIAVFTTGGANPVYSYTFGASVFSGSTPGKVTPLGFHGITGLGFDSSGNFYVSCTGDPHDVGTGTYLRKFNGDATTATETWQITGLQFVAGGSLDPANLNQFYSSYSGYSMNWPSSPTTGTGTGTVATWNMDIFNPGLYPTDKTTSDVSSDWLIPGNGGDNAPLTENHPMVFEVRDIQGKPFLFTDAMNMGNILGVMRMNGDVAVPACMFGYDRNGWPADATAGKSYMWNDANGDGCMQAGEFTINSIPIPITLCGKWIDDNANIWTTNRVTSGTGLGEITEVTLATTPLNAYGVPQYNVTTPKNTWVAGTNNVTTDTDWTGVVQLAYLAASDTMIITGNTSTHTSGATNTYDVVRAYQNWSTATTTNKIGHVWEVDGTAWRGLYAIGSYVFASAGVNNVNAISVYSLSAGSFMGTFTPVGVSPTGLNDEDNPINVRVLADGSYVIFQENDLTNNNTIYHWVPPGGPSFHTTNVVNSNAHTLIQATSTANADQSDQTTFATNVATAYSNGYGGVVNFDVSGDALTAAPAIVANYSSNAKTLSIGVTANSALAISPLAPPSGTTGVTNCLSAPNGASDPNLGDITFTMGAVTGGVANEKVTSFSFTYLTQTVLNGLSVTVTATFSDNSTSTVTRTVNRNTSSPTVDTFYAFVAPSGKSITSVALTSNTTRANTTNIDDVGFITAAVP
jgi:hypothetical protein